MRWLGRRESSNVEDRRGMRTVGFVGAGAGGIIIALIYMFLGGDPSVVLNNLTTQGEQPDSTAPQREGDDERRHFVGVVLADTEDVWNHAFSAEGKRYVEPKLVLFSGRVDSACGLASSAVGPFYCPGDRNLYLDLNFFDQLEKRLGAPGDFAQAYVIAHEVGHHVQNLLGLMPQGRSSVAVELQADCLAGYWAHATQSMTQALEPGDIDEALGAASAVGDDALQKARQGYVVPDSFTHGSSAQRKAAFNVGYNANSWQGCKDAF